MDNFGSLHHVELQQVSDLRSSVDTWTWLFDALGYTPHQEWSGGRGWRHGSTYIVLASASRGGAHDRRLPGLSHLAFHAGTMQNVDRLWTAAPQNGWSRLYADRHPRAGGDQHYAAFLEKAERFKVELVASDAVR
ncbi:glyoxalase/bleomycin resistance protein/dioxygenase superfamily protein [Georgenia soli]|uniref:Glyoxalase/bleomycin resistance protein/dioxygenase superfamily protein n=1 Tax=Georgenia soli TaxID=638953 RepID=A0A2A9ELA5_9MICO|nr:VOC family protein [Georgenia soli]PFG39688.1 glyoxalase/bleomycin resistance protein/dioxygenase superfamily protein [Georgenia soli]